MKDQYLKNWECMSARYRGQKDGERERTKIDVIEIDLDLEEFKRYCEEQSRSTMVRLWAVWERVYIFFTEFR